MITTNKPMLAAALCLGIIIPVTLFSVNVKPVNAAVSINVTDTSAADIRSYYSSLNSLSSSQRSGANLLTNLKPVLSNGHTTISYATVWSWSKITDRDWAQSPMTPTELANYTLDSDNPYVHLLYRNDNGTSTAGHADDDHNLYINREHTWPQSYGFSAGTAQPPAGTDVHHLMLADKVNNSEGHSNYFYGNSTLVSPNIGTAANHNDTGRKESITYNGVTQLIYEPQDSDKGDIARACFYMVARYSSWSSTYDPWLTLSDSLNDYITAATYSSTSAIGYGLKSVLLEWNALDPVDDYEIHRNNLIYNNVQHNRNPFIDYPSWVDVVWGTGGAVANPATDSVRLYGQSSSAPTSLTLSPASSTIAVGSSETLLVTPTPSSASSSVTWSSNNNGVATVSGGVVTGVAAGSATITATSTLNAAVSATCTITVSAAPVKALTSITLSGSSSSAIYKSTYSTSGIVVTAHYSDATTANITSTASINAPDTSILGSQSVRVSYTENAITQLAYYDVKVTNNGATIGPKIGSEYVSATAALGEINGWTNVETGTPVYADGSVKLDGSGDYLYNANIWSGSFSTGFSSIALTVKIKQNGGTDNTTPNVMTVYAINGSDSVEIASVSQTAGFNTTAADEFFTISGISASATITGIKIVYTTKSSGNLGVYYVKATPTYIDTATNLEQATAFANYVMDGIGGSAAGSCSSVFTELQSEYNYMVSASKAEFNTNSGELFALARDRYNYLANYLGRQGDTIGALVSTEEASNDGSSFGLILLVAILGLTTIVLYSFSNRKNNRLDA